MKDGEGERELRRLSCPELLSLPFTDTDDIDDTDNDDDDDDGFKMFETNFFSFKYCSCLVPSLTSFKCSFVASSCFVQAFFISLFFKINKKFKLKKYFLLEKFKLTKKKKF